jgi:GMP synthase (glutamine-hydrolysing)
VTNFLSGPKVIILDYGSQYTQLIARAIRGLKVYCEVHPATLCVEAIRALNPSALVLSGGPGSVNGEGALGAPKELFDPGLPILGICYGQQLMAHVLGGRVITGDTHEYGRAFIAPAQQVPEHVRPMFAGFDSQTPVEVWMSHGDRVDALPDDFVAIAGTDATPYAAIAHRQHPWVGLQFHPEVSHTPRGLEILEGFVFSVAKLRPDWTMASFMHDELDVLRHQIEDDSQIICALSGGVDSSVVAALLGRALGQRLHCIFIDTGLLRAGEREQVREVFDRALGLPLHIVDAADIFLSALGGITDPEAKRRAIGKAFIDVFEREAKKIPKAKYLAQGTLYSDVIESMSIGKSQAIKSHHNVGGLPERMHLKLIEPLRELFKDEVRVLGEQLGLPHHVCYRQPFPGPGLAIRVVGEVTAERLAVLRQADTIVQQELAQSPFAQSVWQCFAVLLPVRSVGVMGDARTYEETMSLRAVDSIDGMTADWSRLSFDLLGKISNRVINEVRGINRVLYDISSKPPATIEWE